MTERERLLEKIRKVQALANRGADGEKQSAAALLDKLMKQYGIDEAEIAEERLEKCFFRYKTPYERKLLVQVIYTVTGKIPFKCVGSYSGRARKQVGIDCTAAERLEIEFSYEFYKAPVFSANPYVSLSLHLKERKTCCSTLPGAVTISAPTITI